METIARYDTGQVAPAERFAYWHDAVCESYVRLGCDALETVDFHGSITVAHHSVLSISEVAGSAHRVERRKQDIRASNDAFFLLSLQRRSTTRITQNGNTANLRVGDMALYSSTEPYRLDLTDGFCQAVVQLPAAKLLSRLPHADMLTGLRIDGQSGIGALVRRNILAFADYADADDPTMHALVQDTLIDLIATGLAAQGAAPVALSSPERHVMLRARAFIRDNLSDPHLDRHRVAAEMGMSVRRLNEIFAKQEVSLTGLIRRERLQAVADDLRDPRLRAQTISEIAFRNGFSNLQNFSTLFRKTFGRNPRDFRQGS